MSSRTRPQWSYNITNKKKDREVKIQNSHQLEPPGFQFLKLQGMNSCPMHLVTRLSELLFRVTKAFLRETIISYLAFMWMKLCVYEINCLGPQGLRSLQIIPVSVLQRMSYFIGVFFSFLCLYACIIQQTTIELEK